jgi:plastocyanin
MKKITGSAVICIAAATFALVALLLSPSASPFNSPSPTAAGARVEGSPAPPVTAADGGPADSVAGNGAFTDTDSYASASPAGRGRAAGSPSAVPTKLTLSDFSFGKAEAAPGATVTVSNLDGTPHTVAAENGGFDSGEVRAGGQGSFVAPRAPGTYPFFCEIHPSMTGELVVR